MNNAIESVFKILCQFKFEAKSVVESGLGEGNMLVQVEIVII